MNSRYYAEFEKLGEAKVRESLALGQFHVTRRDAAHHWIDERERARSDASQAEQLSIARDARDAAWEAVRAARAANIMARIAIAIAAASVIVAAIGYFFPR